MSVGSFFLADLLSVRVGLIRLHALLAALGESTKSSSEHNQARQPTPRQLIDGFASVRLTSTWRSTSWTSLSWLAVQSVSFFTKCLELALSCTNIAKSVTKRLIAKLQKRSHAISNGSGAANGFQPWTVAF
ncbi:hypothetical protein KIN20_019783 [Parelaphostrongylus tenuis]|uniref:Secreted protein n=1 Tax=Parelaphostrongylus tenuis TaxID=148309 RepID=A0AAD5N598_PARTN|nr:hypothetical protein KIN20_019783 [Parelaphostrongylus tenuis]